MPIRRVTLPWDELNDNAYNGGKKLIRDLGRQAKGIACQLYRDTPGALIPNPASNFLTGMWDGICSDDPQGLPPPPQPDFDGGQCAKNYYVDGTISFVNRNCNGDFVGTGQYTIPQTTVRGPIYGYRSVIMGISRCNSEGYTLSLQLDCHGYPSGGNNRGWYAVTGIWGSRNSYLYNDRKEVTVSLTLTPTDGSPDDCGSPPPNYPPPPPTYTPPAGDITINPSLTVPFAWIDADFSLDIKPYIDVGGIKINFDIGGINFEFNSDNPPPTYDPDINPLPDTLFPPVPLPPPGWGDIQVDIDNTNNIVNDIDTKIDTKADKTDIPDYQDELDRIETKIDTLPPPPPPFVPCPTAKQDFVRVTANISNYVGKTIFTDDDNEIVVFGGYIRFLIDGEPYGEEFPIRRLVQHFLLPHWATGYRLVPQNQVILSGVIVKKTVDLPKVTLLDCSGETE